MMFERHRRDTIHAFVCVDVSTVRSRAAANMDCQTVRDSATMITFRCLVLFCFVFVDEKKMIIKSTFDWCFDLIGTDRNDLKSSDKCEARHRFELVAIELEIEQRY